MKSSKVRQILAELQRIKVLSQSHTFTLISAVFTPQSKMASETVKKSNMTDYKPRLGYRWKSNKCYLFECTCFEFYNCWRIVTENLASIFWSNFFSSSLCTPWPVDNSFSEYHDFVMVRRICMHGKRPTKNHVIWTLLYHFSESFGKSEFSSNHIYINIKSVLLVIVDVTFYMRVLPSASPKKISCTYPVSHVH